MNTTNISVGIIASILIMEAILFVLPDGKGELAIPIGLLVAVVVVGLRCRCKVAPGSARGSG